MLPEILQNKVEFLKGVGPAKASLLKSELNISDFSHLIAYFPFRYVDRTQIYPISSISADESFVQISGIFEFFDIHGKSSHSRLEAVFSDNTASIRIIWFQNFKWVTEKIHTNTPYYLFGKVTTFKDEPYISHPEILTVDEFKRLPFSGKFQPVYSSTEKLKKRGIDSKAISFLTAQVIQKVYGAIPETLPQYLLESLKLPEINQAFQNIHIPSSYNSLDRSLKRFRFEEALLLQLRHRINADKRKRNPSVIVFEKVGKNFNSFFHHALGFELTNAQKEVMKEIRRDVGSGFRMNRLLQGDVGSGKTVVALMAMLIATDNGYQACIMAPTEILAQQHFNTISKWVINSNVSVAMLTGSTKSKARKQILTNLAEGTLNIIIGTHTLIEDSVVFQNLGLAIVDEQHRFGVLQRAKILNKNENPPHVLVMTATPIPRTLAMTFYGDLDVSVINELPPGRKPINTLFYYDNQRIHAWEIIRREVNAGRQVYIVYPLIKESEKLDLIALENGYEAIIRDFAMPKYEVGILHGRMTQDEKDFVMNRFSKGLTDILVSTTVIEVGVDVANASVMIIENAERFGLSQLHQLRGRVGRGASQSHCILIGSQTLSDEAKARIKAMLDTNDGFRIAEADLKLRGPGDIMGTRQSGDIDFKYIDLVRDEKIIDHARNIAEQICANDSSLSKPEHQCLLEALKQRFGGTTLAEIA
ncbi:MAG: ATP-dependent DNA helicase RecG [Bacteroidetes bacterium HGW-Bacteroidetes-6]|jgi:ATP-dependent DNA helicase RecG|nr:MAG: ATP-dependent DNA helicase RecG [Bacteroidetes bacterium HGW-Bacteroidetes-6]